VIERILIILTASLIGGASAFAGTVRIVDSQGQGIAGVSVLIGNAANDPFPENLLKTDSAGEFMTPPGWTEALPVTLEGPGLVRTTHLNVMPTVATLSSSQADGDSNFELSGTLTDFGTLRTDGKADVGVFIPALNIEELFYFDVGWLVSPESDKMTVFGQEVSVPSNVAIPRQTENYIFPITLDKPNFRMYVRRPGPQKFLSVHGQFPFQRVIDDARAGKAPYDIVNNLTLVSTGIVDLDVNDSIKDLTLPVSGTNFSESINIMAPAMTDSDVIMAVAFSDIDGQGHLVPSDIKRLKNNQAQTLKVPAAAGGSMALSSWMKKISKAMTAPIQDFAPMNFFEALAAIGRLARGEPYDVKPAASVDVNFSQVSFASHLSADQAPRFLALVAPPTVNGTSLRLAPPVEVSGVTPISTLVIYSLITHPTGGGKTKMEKRTRKWEVWTNGWATDVTLPSLDGFTGSPGDKWRWEVLYFGKENVGPGQLNTFKTPYTHVTRNSIDL
jgi:hypothetical protein